MFRRSVGNGNGFDFSGDERRFFGVFMLDFLAIPEAVVLIKISVVVCLIVLAVYAVLRIRDFAAGKMPRSGEYVTEFENMRDDGLIDDKELSQVKTAIGRESSDLMEKLEAGDSFED